MHICIFIMQQLLQLYERDIKALKSELSDTKKQSAKTVKKLESIERELRQIKVMLERRDIGGGASGRSRSAAAGDTQQVLMLSM